MTSAGEPAGYFAGRHSETRALERVEGSAEGGSQAATMSMIIAEDSGRERARANA